VLGWWGRVGGSNEFVSGSGGLLRFGRQRHSQVFFASKHSQAWDPRLEVMWRRFSISAWLISGLSAG